MGRERADHDRHHQKQAEHQHGRRVELAQGRQKMPVERQEGHHPDRERLQDPGEMGDRQHGQQQEQANQDRGHVRPRGGPSIAARTNAAAPTAKASTISAPSRPRGQQAAARSCLQRRLVAPSEARRNPAAMNRDCHRRPQRATARLGRSVTRPTRWRTPVHNGSLDVAAAARTDAR
jgi:hypothetical protein